jgi:hypothetical protein
VEQASSTNAVSPAVVPSATSTLASSSAALATTGAVNPGIKIIATGYYVEGKEMLRVRATPSSAGTELGFVEVGQTYKHLPAEQKDWYQIEFPTQDGLGVQTGWVSANYAELVQ